MSTGNNDVARGPPTSTTPPPPSPLGLPLRLPSSTSASSDDHDHPDRSPRSSSNNNAATAASAAGARALSAQVVAFYFRAPAKAFFRTRVDYLGYARVVHQARLQALMDAATASSDTTAAASSRWTFLRRQAWLWARSTTPGVLTSAVREQGWAVVPNQILPPLVANVGVGAVLYTSYLQILGRLHEGSARASRRVYPPPPPSATFAAGFLAGGLQSVVAAPLDALQARFDHRDLMRDGSGGSGDGGGGRPRSMWSFGWDKLRQIGLRGIFAGWGLSFAKDSLGSAVFFSAFEYVKAQGYYRFVTWYYGGLAQDMVDVLAMKRPPGSHHHHDDDDAHSTVIRPHYALEPMFLLLAGTSASFAQQVLLHPLTHFQVKHWDHLEELDDKAARIRASSSSSSSSSPSKPSQQPSSAAAAAAAAPRPRWRMLRAYYHAYQETWAGCAAEAAAEGQGLARWLYRGFWWNAVRQVPSTSAGLIIFELIRRKYGFGAQEVRITKDGYDILLN